MVKRLKREQIGIKHLAKMIAESSGYHLYEVRDVLDHLVAVMTRELIKGNAIRLKGIGQFYLKATPPMTWYSGALKREVSKPALARVRYGMDIEMKRSISLEGDLTKMLLGEDEDE